MSHTNSISAKSSILVSKNISEVLIKLPNDNRSPAVELDLIDNDILKIINDPLLVPDVSAVTLAVVLEELADQLDVLGRSVGGPEIELRSKQSVEFDQSERRGRPGHRTRSPGQGAEVTEDGERSEDGVEVEEMEGTEVRFKEPAEFKQSHGDEDEHCEKYLLQQHYQSVLPRRVRQGVEGPYTLYTRRLSAAIRASYLNTLTSNGKLMVDRAYLQKAIQDLMIDVIQKSSMNSLVELIATEKANKEEMKRLAYSGIKHRNMADALTAAIKQAKKDKKLDTNKNHRIIWSLEDATQELLTRTGMEHAYMTHTGKMIAARSRKRCDKVQAEYALRLENAKWDLTNEYHVHSAMMDALGNKMSEVIAKLDFWMDKYDADKEQLQGELDAMKASRERDLKHIASLRHIIYNYNQIVVDYRRIKAIEEARRVRSELEHKRSIKIQAWWRGEMVRKKLGPYKIQKPVKAKKGKKDKGKKKK